MPVCRFEPWGREIEVEIHSTVLAAARACGVPIEAACGGARACGTCAVKVLEGLLAEPSEHEIEIIKGQPVRLACRAEIISDVVVRPLIGIAARAPKKAGTFSLENPFGEMASEALHVRAAVDLGTTTIKTALVATDATAKNEIYAEAHSAGYQASWGADVVSRVSHASRDKRQSERLMNSAQEAVVSAIKTCMIELMAQGKARYIALDRIQIAGNPLVSALLCGASLEAYLQPPYGDDSVELRVTRGPLYDLARTGRTDASEIRITPALGRLVGGDITAALVGIESDNAAVQKPYLYIDMGTNVECALVTENEIFVGSAPAGSAFAAEGETGSLAIARIEELLSVGALSRDGLLQEDHMRVARNASGVLEVAYEGETITQMDVRSFQLIKAAFAVSIGEVVRASSLSMQEIETVYLGGVFANNTDIEALFNTGFFPKGLKGASIKHMAQLVMEGAGVLSGLSDTVARNLTDSLISKVHAVDLVQNPDFNAHLLSALSFQ